MILAEATRTDVLHQLLPGPGAWLGLAAILGVICWIAFRVRAYWREDADGDASLRQMLAQFRESHREGVLTDEEYRLIRSRLARPASPITITERSEPAPDGTGSAKGLADPNENR
jgi:hypothetical protein